MPMLDGIKKVMLIGSGPIVIGQAAEFDYAGTQACRVLKQAGLEVVLVQLQPGDDHDRSPPPRTMRPPSPPTRSIWNP